MTPEFSAAIAARLMRSGLRPCVHSRSHYARRVPHLRTSDDTCSATGTLHAAFVGNMKNADLDGLREQLLQLERLIQQITELQARQIDRERNVPGTDPPELVAIDADLASVRGTTLKLVEMQHAISHPERTAQGASAR
jgi:hypothetical protein